jgi:hypothetical protein
MRSGTTNATTEAVHRHAHRGREGYCHRRERAERLLDRHTSKMREDQLASSVGEPIAEEGVIARLI